jgi:CheY-like chemotaxis protein
MAVVLIVDDTDSAKVVLSKLLRREGFETRTAGSATEALAALEEAVPDLVLLDISMPEMDGLSLLELLHRHPRWSNLPVIMFTALDARPLIERAELLGAKAYCVKGRDSFTQVLAHVREHIVA